VGFWVMLCSTTWFSQFLLHEYDNDKWVANFRFNKEGIFYLFALLDAHYEWQDT
jgi:hypothetical protein